MEALIDKIGARLLRESEIIHKCDPEQGDSEIIVRDHAKDLYKIKMSWGVINSIESWDGVKWWKWKERKEND